MRLGDMYHLKHMSVMDKLNNGVSDALEIPGGLRCDFFLANGGDDYVATHAGLSARRLYAAEPGSILSYVYGRRNRP